MNNSIGTASERSAFAFSSILPPEVFRDDRVYLNAVTKGISGQVVKWAVNEMPSQREAIVSALGTTSGNLSRLYARPLLDKHQSEEMLDILRVYNEACAIFGTQKKADLWLSIRIPALRGEVPKDLLDTFIGRRLVLEALNKIKYGEFS